MRRVGRIALSYVLLLYSTFGVEFTGLPLTEMMHCLLCMWRWSVCVLKLIVSYVCYASLRKSADAIVRLAQAKKNIEYCA